MLYADTFRGEDSTGVFAGFIKNSDKSHVIQLEKAAIAGDQFLRSQLWEKVRVLRTPSVSGVGAVVTTQPKFLVGHNRAATRGAVVDANAHPFQHGHITLVHNGTLDNQSLLPDHENFKVDSENVAWSISKIGAAETIQKLDGAFTLVWHDSQLNTLNFIRNSKRPFYIVETTTGDYFGASEKDMIAWIFTRTKYGPVIKRGFECEEGVQYVFDTSAGFKFKEEIKHTLPIFQKTYTYASRSSWDTYDDYYSASGSYTSRYTTPTTIPVIDKNAEINELMFDSGIKLKIGEWVTFEAYQFDPYQGTPNRGKMTGFTGSSSYVEVQAHGFESSEYIENGLFKGKITSAFEMNYMLHIIVAHTVNAAIKDTEDAAIAEAMKEELEILESKLEAIPWKDDSELFLEGVVENSNDYGDEDDIDNPEEVEITANGFVTTKKEWEDNGSLNCCGNCGSPIMFDDVPGAEVHNGFSYCEECLEDSPDSISDSKINFVCEICKEDYHVDMESVKDCVCIHCYAETYKPVPRPVLSLVTFKKELTNKMLVTRKHWEVMNSCGWCTTKIDWKHAETTEFLGQKPCCNICSKKMSGS